MDNLYEIYLAQAKLMHQDPKVWKGHMIKRYMPQIKEIIEIEEPKAPVKNPEDKRMPPKEGVVGRKLFGGRKKRGGTIQPRFGGVDTPLTHFVVRAIGDGDNGPINDFLGSIRNRQTDGYFLENNDSLEDRAENFADDLEVMAGEQDYIGGYFKITYDTSNHDNFISYGGGSGFFSYEHTRNIPNLQEFIANNNIHSLCNLQSSRNRDYFK